MPWLNSTLALLAGLSMRLAIPIAITVLLVYFLRRLDARWQSEAEQVPPGDLNPPCWKIKACPAAERRACPALQSELTCWQVFRRPNGYLREQCLTCVVFLRAPMRELQPQTI